MTPLRLPEYSCNVLFLSCRLYLKIFTQKFERKTLQLSQQAWKKLVVLCVLVRAGRLVVYFDEYCT